MACSTPELLALVALGEDDSRAENMVLMGTLDGVTGSFPISPSMDLAAHPIVNVSMEPTGDTAPGRFDVSVVRGRLPL